ncbi:ABC transporter ATP-binding protein [Bordetella hinzii]|uniref:ABC transporter ATP-binding protein n=2 Tax=Bordetella hinzii TaxID=103855 RepID=A0AAN1RWP7_9BORD|nr:ABC transporter ATP-binding protein [Bordetella hinzii]AKQ57700.1 Lipopolysaccharide export system ATP-binding protein LptB [Bordetella hinzii]AKQ62167.1 Lipopolysaccharide export system ATP-binding protein LptB [Bordetella hinzii]AZW16928.1 ABC transporter ATP-binding protein [Bordetella hinzii]KCB24018.1 branched-chain amino acid ABC transporter [Bordetella hinzii OH87 BAL007II]KCB28143.1 branched-chain amino acid ABC transporter [Bordetella hinzii CA90 BAL1384]
MKPTSPILEARNIARRFGGVVAVKDANLTVGEGEIVGLIGPNGSGKSTMVNLITGELAPNSGSIRFGGRDITALPSFQRARMGMARSFQMLRLFHSLSVEDNLLLAHHIRMQSGTVASIFGRRAARDEEAAVRKRARELLQWFELEPFADRPVTALSIGQQRMVELARGVISDPRLFLLDEPAAGLSPPNVDRLIKLIRRMRDEFGISILLVEHDMRVVRELCDRVTVLDTGTVIAQGEPEAVVTDPVVVEAYIGSGWKRRAQA